MGTAAIPVVLLILLIFFAWRTVFSFNGDLVRAKEWGELARRSFPFGALTLMALTMFPVQALRDSTATFVWLALSAVAIIGANLLSTPPKERKANRAFRTGDFAGAAAMYRELADEKPLARHLAFLGAALGASERLQESVDASTRAIEKDPKYGLAYYNRALVLNRMGKKGRAKKDLQNTLEADAPRRFKSAAKKMLEGLS